MSDKNCITADTVADKDPTTATAVDSLIHDHEDIKDTKSKASTMGMDEVGVEVAESNTVSDKDCITANTVTIEDPTTAVDGPNDDHKDVKDAKPKVSTLGMDEVEVDRKNDNEVGIAVNGVNDDDEDVRDVDEAIAMDEVVGHDNDVNEDGENTNFGGKKDDMDENAVREVRLHSHCLHMSPP